MSEKLPNDNNGLLELLKKLWLPFAGFIGAVSLTYSFYKMWLGDQEAVTYITAGAGLLILILALLWVGFRNRTITRPAVWPIGGTRTETYPLFKPSYRKAAQVGLSVITLLAIFGFVILGQHLHSQKKYRTEQEQKLIILIAAFEGPEEVYGLRNEIIEKLNANFSGEKNIEIIPVDEIITVTQGSVYARQLGEHRLADIVIWGWYRPTENPNITIHIENLTLEKMLPIRKSEILQPAATLAELESFSFQQQAGQETSALISFLAGFINYNIEDYWTFDKLKKLA